MPSEKKNEREEQIKKQAKEILDKFARALSKVKAKEEDFFVERDEDRREERKEREENEGKRYSDFISRFFDNAPSVKNKCILAERGGWK